MIEPLFPCQVMIFFHLFLVFIQKSKADIQLENISDLQWSQSQSQIFGPPRTFINHIEDVMQVLELLVSDP